MGVVNIADARAKVDDEDRACSRSIPNLNPS